MKINFHNPIIQWLTLLVLAFIWGSSFILIKKSLVVFSIYDIATFRIFIGAFILLPFALNAFRELRGRHFWPLLAVGLLGTGIPSFLFPIAQTVIDSSLAGILNSMVPLFALIVGVSFFQLKVKRMQVIGVVIGLFGAVGLFGLGGINWNGNPLYGLFAVGASLCYALGVNIIKRYLQPVNSVAITALSMFLIAPPALVYLLVSGFPQKVATTPGGWMGLVYLCFLGIMSSALAVVVFNVLIKRTSPLFATSVTYLIPVVAIFWGILAGEQVGWQQIAMFTLILSGVYMVNRAG